jgi:hypothetical protein
MATAITTAGDLIKGTGSGTFDRLGIGSTGQVLTVASGAPAWSTPTGANKSYSLLSTTTLTGSQTITVTGLSGYDNFLIQIHNGQGVESAYAANLRINTDTGTNYTYAGNALTFGSSYAASILDDSFSNAATSFPLAQMASGAGLNRFSAGISILGGNSTGFKEVAINGTADIGQSPASDGQRAYNILGIYKGSAVISSISVIATGTTNFSSGTLYIYGAV